MFRPASMADAQLLLAWRWEAESAEFWGGHPITAERHLAWLEARLASPSVRLLIWEEPIGEPVGMVRIDSNGELAFYAPDGEVAERMLKAAVLEHAAAYERLKASVDEADSATWRALQAAGFVRDRSVKFFIRKS